MPIACEGFTCTSTTVGHWLILVDVDCWYFWHKSKDCQWLAERLNFLLQRIVVRRTWQLVNCLAVQIITYNLEKNNLELICCMLYVLAKYTICSKLIWQMYINAGQWTMKILAYTYAHWSNFSFKFWEYAMIKIWYNNYNKIFVRLWDFKNRKRAKKYSLLLLPLLRLCSV